MNCLAVLQVASVAGVAGICFLLFFVPGAVMALLSGKGTRGIRLITGSCVIVLAVAVLGLGTLRLSKPIPGARVEVGLVASDLPRNLRPRDPEQIRRTFTEYAAIARELIRRGARLVVLPEKDAIVSASTVDDTDRIFGETAREGAIVAVGVERWTGEAKLNEIRVYGPDGRLRATYEKHHMLPPFESNLLPGTTLKSLQQPSGTWGLQICKDMDFPALSREYGNENAGLLIVPAWDFDMDGWYHGRMAIMRGVESGFSIVRAPKEGVLTVSDDRGRVLAERQTNAADFTTLLASVPVHHDATLYDRWGDWFAWCNVGLLAGCLLSAICSKVIRLSGEL